MLTLQEVVAQQRDLARLCADRSRPHSELYEQNELYGYAEILKRVAGVSPTRPVHFVIPHGVSMHGAIPWDVATDARTVYSFQREVDSQLSRHGRRAVVAGACPLVHVADEVGIPSPTQRQGTLFFPSHTIRTVDADAEYDRIADTLSALPAWMHPVRICLYWADYEKGQHAPFIERGFHVVSAGHMWDPQFAYRLAHLLGMHALAAGNTFGTHTMFALHMGCAYMHVPGTVRYRARAGLESHLVRPNHFLLSSLKRMFAPLEAVQAADARRLADGMLGVDRRRSPESLADAIVAAERRSRLGVVA